MMDEIKIRAALQLRFIPWLRAKYPDIDAAKKADEVLAWLKSGPHYSEGYYNVRT